MNTKKISRYNNFYNRLSKIMENGNELSIRQIYSFFPDENPKTISWRIHNLITQGKLRKTGHGYYTTMEDHEYIVTDYDYLQTKSKSIYDLLIEYSFNFYITGIDSLISEVLHVPENYPVLLVMEERNIDVILEILNDNNMIVVTEKNNKLFNKTGLKDKIDVIILQGKDFIFSVENIAQKEKGFIDLYYAVTRMSYSLSIPELSRIYSNLTRNRIIVKNRMIKAAKDRGVSTEIKWLLNIDTVADKALEFMMYQQKERRSI